MASLAVVDEALKGQLAPVQVSVRSVRLYPSTPATEGKPEEDSLAHRLLKHMGPADQTGGIGTRR